MRNLKRALSLGLTAAMISGLMVMGSSAASYADVTSENNVEAIEVLEAVGIMIGDENGNFNPDQNVTRNEMAVVMANLMEYNVASYKDTSPFTDVPSWAEPYVAACYTNGITSGYSDTVYGGSDNVTTAQAALMLMKALGYFQYSSDFGSDWQLATTRQGNAIDLFVGVDSGVTQPMTRNDVAQLVLNTLKSGTVEASTDGSWSIGDVTINNNVTYSFITSNQTYATAIDDVRSTSNTTDANRSIVELGEQLYMGDLKLEDDTFDDFNRPSRTWSYEGDEIGTYAKKELLQVSYTTEVEGGDIYGDIGTSACDYDLTYSVDGVELGGAATDDEAAKLARRNSEDMYTTGNGVLTEVYVDIDKEETYIVEIHTYLAEALNDYNETSEVATLRVYDGREAYTNYDVDVETVPNVTDVTEGTFYQVNISKKNVSPNGEVLVLNDVQVLEDSEISKYSSDDGNKGNAKVTKLTTDGTEYEGNKDAYYDDEILYQYNENLLTDNSYNIYLDQYGYFLGVDLYEGTKNYVFITGFDRNTSNLAVKTATANAIFLDGTMDNIQVNVTATDDNIEDAYDDYNAANSNVELFVPWSTIPYSSDSWTDLGKQGDEGINNLNQWYTYTVNDAGVYTLKPCVNMTWTQYGMTDPATDDETIIRTDNLSIKDVHPKAVTGTTPLSTRVYGEDETVFITVDLDIVDTTGGIKKAITDVNGVYTGVQSVDLIVDTTDPQAYQLGQVYTVSDSKGYVIGAVVIGEAQGNTGNYAYILSQAKSEEKIGDTYYWTFEAVYEGEKQTLTARSSYEDTIDNIERGKVVELRFDADGYVVNVKNASKLYEDYNLEIDGYDVYNMKDVTVGENVPEVVRLQGNTLYITDDRTDKGLGIASGAKAVVIQPENGKEVITNCSSVEAAVNRLADPDDSTTIKEYNGKIVAVLDSRGAAAWIVFDSETPLGGNNYNDVNRGNVETIYADGYKQHGVNLKGSSADATFSVNDYGMLSISMEYEAPEWVPDEATVELAAPLYYNNAYLRTVTFNPAVIYNGEAHVTSGTFFYGQYMGYDASKFSFGKLTTEDFSEVSVYYLDQARNNIADRLVDEETELYTDASNPKALHFELHNSAAANNVSLTSYNMDNGWTNDTTYQFDDLNTGWNTNVNKSASGNLPVIITLDLTGMTNLYSALNSSIALSNFDEADDAQVAADKELKISFTSPTTNLQTGAAVDFTISFTPNTFNTGDIRAYHVVIPKLGVDTIIFALDDEFDSTDTGYEPAYIGTENLQITAADVKLEAIDALEVTGVSISGNKAIISFNRDVTVTGGKSAVSVTGNAAGQVATAVANAGAQTVTVTLNPGHVFGENDTITINNGTGKISDSYGYEIAAGTVAQ